MMHHKANRTLGAIGNGKPGAGKRSTGKRGVTHVSKRTLGTLALGVLCGGVAVACAGGDTPARDSELEAAIAQAYGDGVGVAGSGPAPAGGSGGSAAGGSGQGGSASVPTAGAAGSMAGEGGGEPVGEAGSGGGGVCDGFEILQLKCNGPSCHGDGSGVSGFAASEEAARGYVDVTASGPACASESDALISPANPSNSLLVQKVDGSTPCGIAMPIGAPLSDEEIDCIEEWIASL